MVKGAVIGPLPRPVMHWVLQTQQSWTIPDELPRGRTRSGCIGGRQ